MIRCFIFLLIRCYQRTLSPDHGPLRWLFPYGCCPLRPTCSQYCLESIQRYSVIKGMLRAVRRIIRCNPWTTPRYDTV